MIARLLISPDLEERVEEINKTLRSHLGSGVLNHPDVLYFSADSKLGIAEARKIKEHFSLKPYSAKGRAVVMENASNLTIEAQNALLKTLEEPPAEAILILGAPSDVKFLPTILSRCEIVRLKHTNSERSKYQSKYAEDIGRLITSSKEERFEYVEKLKDRQEFLKALVLYFHQNLVSQAPHMSSGEANFLKELLTAEQWAEANVNIRAILEYLMLVMPSKL